MPILSEFLGSLASGICDARANSDVQTVRIAEEYVKNDLLKHFSIPRMRIDKVEMNIPIAVHNLEETIQRDYRPIIKSDLSNKIYKRILAVSGASSFSREASISMKKSINDQIDVLITGLGSQSVDKLSKEVSERISVRAIELGEVALGKSAIVETSGLRTSSISEGVEAIFREELILEKESKKLGSFEVIVEADKLREIKPENVIMIKMTISEEGMEWVTVEDKDGNMVPKLMPE